MPSLARKFSAVCTVYKRGPMSLHLFKLRRGWMLVTSAGCGGTSVRLCLDRRLSRAGWSRRRCLFLHFDLCTRLRLEDGTSLWGTDLKTSKNSSLSVCWCCFFHDEQSFNRVHLAELSLCLPQSDFVFDHLSLHLLVVGLQCADEMTHLSVDGTLEKQASKVNQGKKRDQ